LLQPKSNTKEHLKKARHLRNQTAAATREEIASALSIQQLQKSLFKDPSQLMASKQLLRSSQSSMVSLFHKNALLTQANIPVVTDYIGETLNVQVAYKPLRNAP
jgi:hypothetical protein